MHLYQLKVVIKDNKLLEFHNSLAPLLGELRGEIGCVDFGLYEYTKYKNIYIIIGKWRTRQAMEIHFKGDNYKILIGMAKVLGETFEINIAKFMKQEALI